jgi:hypothetical protein
METNTEKTPAPIKVTVETIIGYILLAPALLSVLLFVVHLFGAETLKTFQNDSPWTGIWGISGAYTSALPFYFGLMAIAGAYLIKKPKE